MPGWLSWILLVFIIAELRSEKKRFDNYVVFRVQPSNETQLSVLKNLAENSHDLSFWVEPSEVNSDEYVMVPPKLQPSFQRLVKRLDLHSEVHIKNVQKLIDEERPMEPPKSGFGWSDFYTLDEIYEWLDSLVEKHPGVVTSIVGGQTYEGRDIKGVKVSYNTGNKAVFIEGGMHGREWISPATVTYILNKLLNSQESPLQDLTKSFDFYVFPVVNPDGYVYSHTTNRMWRKTRSKSSEDCYGVDPNRNWNFHWMESRSSSDPCADVYAGLEPFSEIEMKNLSNFLTKISDDLLVYFSFHSYSQLLMFPYGAIRKRVSNYDEMMNCSGSSVDWVKDALNITYAFIWELRDKGRYGFLLPATQIVETGEETIASVAVILDHVKRKLYESVSSNSENVE